MTSFSSGFNQTAAFGLIGGFVLFLHGISRMSEGMQRLAGGRLRSLLAAFIKNRLYGGLIGVGVSALTHSATATAIMVVGIVNAGLIPMIDALAVLLGANLGASLTLQLVTLNPTWLLLPLLLLGAILKLFVRKTHLRDTGEVLFGLALLMLGLHLMTAAFEPLRGNEYFRNVVLAASNKLWFCLLLGAVLSAIAQSVTAVLGLVIALATSGLLPFPAGVALVLGANIGACTATNLAAIGATLAARRTAAAQVLINVVGALVILIFFPVFLQLVGAVSPGTGQADFVVQTAAQVEWFGAQLGDKPYIARHLANANTLYAVICVFLFMPFLGAIAKLTVLLIQGRDPIHAFSLKYIDDRVLNTPPVAVGQARSEIRRMAQLAQEALAETILYIQDARAERQSSLSRREQTLDLLQREITNFLVALSSRSSSTETSQEIVRMMHIVSDLERIGDHCQTLVRLSRRKREWRVAFSSIAERELHEMSDKALGFLTRVVEALEVNDPGIALQAEDYENEIDQIEETLRNRHIARLNTGECSVQPGLIFIDMLQAIEKISDHTFNVAKNISGEA